MKHPRDKSEAKCEIEEMVKENYKNRNCVVILSA